MSAKLKNGLTPKQEALAQKVAGAQRLVDGMTQEQIANAAGYVGPGAKNVVGRFMKIPEFAARVDELVMAGAKQAEIDAAWVFDGVMKIREKGLEEVPIVNRAGDIIGSKVQDLGAAARATELGAKLLGMMVDRQSIELSGEVRRVLEQVINAVVAEVDDPAVRERIIARLSGEGLVGGNTH